MDSITIINPDGTVDSGSLIGFRLPLNAYQQEKQLLQTLPVEILHASAGEEIQEYYGIPESRNVRPAAGPSWEQVVALIDWLDEHPDAR